MKVKSRMATLDDIHDLVRLNALFNGVRVKFDHLSTQFDYPHRVETPIVVEVYNRIVGFTSLCLVPHIFYDKPHAEPTELFVEKPYRRRGIGRLLVTHIERLTYKGGARELFVLTGFDNDEGQYLYHAIGYEDNDRAMSKDLLDEITTIDS